MGALHIHTRPSLNNDAVPSPTDIKKGITENMTFFCIGTNVNDHGIVRCFSKNDLELEMSNILRKTKLERLGIEVKDIDKSSRLITGRMTIYKNYLDRHSCQRSYL